MRAHTHTKGFRGRDGRQGKEEREQGAEDKGDLIGLYHVSRVNAHFHQKSLPNV